MKSLDLNKIKDKSFKTVSTEEALSDVEPFIEIIIAKCPKCNSDKTIVTKQLEFDLLVKCKECGYEFESFEGLK